MPKNEKAPVTQADAARIQSQADRTGTNQDFKSRAQSAADKNAGDTGEKSGDKSGAKQGR